MGKAFFLAFCLVAAWGTARCQIGGARTFGFLDIPNHALLAGVGGVNVSLAGQDVNMFLSNPALANDSLAGYASAGFLDYLADVNLATVAYTHRPMPFGVLSAGIQHLALGEIEGFDNVGNAENDSRSGEVALTVGLSHAVRAFRLGANLKYAASNIAGFRASALLVDIGGAFTHPKHMLTVAITLKNIGVLLGDYTETADSKLPLDLQAGVTFKPKHMPFRFSITGHHLARDGVAYYDPASVVQTDNENPGLAERVFRRTVFGVEVLVSKNFNLRAGYNHRVRRELRLEEAAGGAGLSFGLVFRVKAFEFAYSRGGYHPAGGLNSFTVAANMNRILRKNN